MDQAVNEQLLRFGGGGDTNLHPFTVAVVLFAGVLILLMPRKYVIVPLFFSAVFIPLGQKFVVFGLHFMMFRVLILFAWIRMFFGVLSGGQDAPRFRLNSIDKTLILWALSSTVTFVLLWGEWGAVVDRMGFLYNTFGFYFLFRLLYRNDQDIDRTIKVFAAICAVLAICMAYEQFTGRNLFSIFGGVPLFTDVREGRLRAQGPFAHPILAGTFGASMIPLFLGLWWQSSKSKSFALLGIVSASVVTIASASSTPLLTYLSGIAALCFWPLRRKMRIFRWATVVCLVSLHIVMKAPVWALIARADVVGGSSGYHRYELVNQFIVHFQDWWLLGTKSTGQWGWDLWDTSNQYVEAGLRGGLIAFVLFLAVIVLCYKRLGVARKASAGDTTGERRLWVLGAALFSNLVAFLGISYFDQTIVAWHALLAMIATTTLAAAPKPARAGELTEAYFARPTAALSSAAVPKRAESLRCYSGIGSERSSN
jgi:hypothetical protein